MKTPQHKLSTKDYPTDALTPYYNNPRIGNVEAIASSLKTNGQYKPIVVNLGTHTGRDHEVLAGNHTLAAAQSLGWDTITATTIDVTDEEAAKIVAADNRTSDMATFDNQILISLLDSVPTFEGTGYTEEDYTQLTQASNDAFAAFADSLEDADEEDADEAGTLDLSAEDEHTSRDEEYVAVTITLTVADRDRVRFGLNHVKNSLDLETQAQALLTVLDAYLGNSKDVAAKQKATIKAEVAGDSSAGEE